MQCLAWFHLNSHNFSHSPELQETRTVLVDRLATVRKLKGLMPAESTLGILRRKNCFRNHISKTKLILVLRNTRRKQYSLFSLIRLEAQFAKRTCMLIYIHEKMHRTNVISRHTIIQRAHILFCIILIYKSLMILTI